MTEDQKSIIESMRCEGAGLSEIARRTGLSRNTVKSHCARHGIRPADPSDCTACPQCGRPVGGRNGAKPRRFCSDACRLAWWNAHPERVSRKTWRPYTCAHCGKQGKAYGNSKRKYCSHECYVADRFGSRHD